MPGVRQNFRPFWKSGRRGPVTLARTETSLARKAKSRKPFSARLQISHRGICLSANRKVAGLFSRRRTFSIRLPWMGWCCAPEKESACSMPSTRLSSVGTFSDSDSFLNSRKRDSYRGSSAESVNPKLRNGTTGFLTSSASVIYEMGGIVWGRV